jgi:hypothetical protein
MGLREDVARLLALEPNSYKRRDIARLFGGDRGRASRAVAEAVRQRGLERHGKAQCTVYRLFPSPANFARAAQCPKCGLIEGQSDYARHMRLVHRQPVAPPALTPTEAHCCLGCGKFFGSNAALCDHVEIELLKEVDNTHQDEETE